jgi:hypothetical protein
MCLVSGMSPTYVLSLTRQIQLKKTHQKHGCAKMGMGSNPFSSSCFILSKLHVILDGIKSLFFLMRSQPNVPLFLSLSPLDPKEELKGPSKTSSVEYVIPGSSLPDL